MTKIFIQLVCKKSLLFLEISTKILYQLSSTVSSIDSFPGVANKSIKCYNKLVNK